MDLNVAVEKIRSMEVRGAGRIARFAVSAVKDHIMTSQADSVDNLKADLIDALKLLQATRPTAVSLKNGLRFVYKNSVRQFTGKSPGLDELKSKIIESCDEFISRSENAVSKIGKLGAEIIQDGYTIQTHCNSQEALAPIFEAHRQGKSIQVYATESRPWYQGHLTVRDLAEAKIPVTLIVDSAVRHYMDEIDLVLVGADTITAGGDLINKIGTAQVALAAHDTGVPFIVCAGTYKFSPESLYNPEDKIVIEERDPKEVLADPDKFPGVKIKNPVFDRTPAKYIKEIITDVNIIKTDEVKDFIQKEFGAVESLEFLNDKK
jgi:ribose 1,5-bisphosphate isomerase